MFQRKAGRVHVNARKIAGCRPAGSHEAEFDFYIEIRGIDECKSPVVGSGGLNAAETQRIGIDGQIDALGLDAHAVSAFFVGFTAILVGILGAFLSVFMVALIAAVDLAGSRAGIAGT